MLIIRFFLFLITTSVSNVDHLVCERFLREKKIRGPVNEKSQISFFFFFSFFPFFVMVKYWLGISLVVELWCRATELGIRVLRTGSDEWVRPSGFLLSEFEWHTAGKTVANLPRFHKDAVYFKMYDDFFAYDLYTWFSNLFHPFI